MSVDKEESDASPSYENLPDVILFKVFSYLYIGDLCRAGRVCLRWHHLTRCQMLWKHVDAHDMQLSSHQVQKLVLLLPPCVESLRICSLSTQQRVPFLTPGTTIAIRERCPRLRTLILESAFIAKHIHFTDITVEDLPQRLSVLSLRRSFFHTDQFFCSVSHPTVPKIKVLDCSSCWCLRDNDVPFFSRLSDLQELYLAGCRISDAGAVALLKAVPGLRVLDLESTAVGTPTLAALGRGCRSLEQLFLGSTDVTDEALCAIPSSSSLPALRLVCLRNTRTSCVGLRHLIGALRTLRRLSVSACLSAECALELSVHVVLEKRLQLDKADEGGDNDYCDHFLMRDRRLEA